MVVLVFVSPFMLCTQLHCRPLRVVMQKARHVSPSPCATEDNPFRCVAKVWRRKKKLTLCLHVAAARDHAVEMMVIAGAAIDESLLQLPEVGGGRGCGLEVPAQAVAHRACHHQLLLAYYAVAIVGTRKSIEQDKKLFENGKAEAAKARGR